MKSRKETIALIIVVLIFTIPTISSLLYRFDHPEMTETQLMVHFWDAVTYWPW